ncbi:hypothetical protein P7K49_002719 [Saguinus oedipus]|uniref:Uncharacterized protein n=1 Tax=Saguinus oedipus TaxID=9490 RepID=A0ABQ9WI51_SAGOE|nr:hypothetical protein P7K49_002719 [Saguinus oedipus]
METVLSQIGVQLPHVTSSPFLVLWAQGAAQDEMRGLWSDQGLRPGEEHATGLGEPQSLSSLPFTHFPNKKARAHREARQATGHRCRGPHSPGWALMWRGTTDMWDTHTGHWLGKHAPHTVPPEPELPGWLCGHPARLPTHNSSSSACCQRK